MKKKLLAFALIVTLALSMSAFAASAFADEVAVKDEITNVDYENIAGGWGMGLAVKGFSVAGGYWESIGMEDYVVITKADGTVFSGLTVENCGSQVALARGQGYEPAAGDEVLFKAGFTYGACHLGENVRFVYNGSAFVKQLPESAISEITVVSVNYTTDWGGPTVIYKLSVANPTAYAQYSSGDKAHLSYVNAYGESKPLADCTYVNDGHFISRMGSSVASSVENAYYPLKGDIFTIQNGFTLTQADKAERIKADASFIYDGASFIPYDPATHDVTEFTVTNDAEANVVYIGALMNITYTANEGALFTPKFSSSNTEVATVDANGQVKGIATGTAVITAKVGSIERTFEVQVKPAPVVSSVEFKVSYDIMIEKNADAFIPANFSVVKKYDDGSESTPIVLTSENARFKEAVDTSEIPAVTGKKLVTIVVTLDGEEYELNCFVRIYDVVDIEIKQASVVEWFGFATFIECPNSSFNKANITDVSILANYMDHIEYLRDGEAVTVGSYLLGGGNIALFPPKVGGSSEQVTLDNFFTLQYKHGDIIKLKKGLTMYGHTGIAGTETDDGAWSNEKGMLYREAVLKEDVMFRFEATESSGAWSIYIPYTDIEVAETEMEVALGSKNAVVGAKRVPNNATSGKFTYVSSDETVLTVSENGKITALKVGVATITVTLSGEESVGEKVATIRVNVVNKIIALEITEKLVVAPGTEEIDLSLVKGIYKFGDGSTVEATDLATGMVVGYDPEATGEQVLTIRVEHEGVRYTASLIVEVKAEEQQGCKSDVKGLAGAALFAIGFAAIGLLVIARKKEN